MNALRLHTPPQFNNRSWTVPGVLPHFKLVNAQLSQLRVALVAAKELGGAAAVLPHLWFGKEFNAWPGFGYLHEPRLKKPFAAPADYTMDLVRFAMVCAGPWRCIAGCRTKACPTTNYSRLCHCRMDHEIPNEYREFSFLGKPEATSLLAARVVVTICQVGYMWGQDRWPMRA